MKRVEEKRAFLFGLPRSLANAVVPGKIKELFNLQMGGRRGKFRIGREEPILVGRRFLARGARNGGLGWRCRRSWRRIESLADEFADYFLVRLLTPLRLLELCPEMLREYLDIPFELCMFRHTELVYHTFLTAHALIYLTDMRKLLMGCAGLLLLAGVIGGVWIREEKTGSLHEFKRFVAGIFLVDSVTEAGLRNEYARAKRGGEKLKILIVPGHDDETVGTAYGNLTEAHLTLEAAERLAAYLAREPAFQVLLARNEKGYDPAFTAYLSKNRERILALQRAFKTVMAASVRAGIVDVAPGVEHGTANPETAFKLYGVNQWANEEKVDLVLHIHFNDYPRKRQSGPGYYSGFAIYVPERQYSNAKASMAVAKPLFEQLKKYLPVSNYSKEARGIVEDQDLIALGSNNTLDVAAALIEYGYLYESRFTEPAIQPLAVAELAFQTYQGIRTFFEPARQADSKFETAILPYRWNRDIPKGVLHDSDVFAFQTALRRLGLYPPRGMSLNQCPINGNFGDCTAQALKAFKEKTSIPFSTSGLDAVTRKALNGLYGK